jgi:hypothetical protein
VAIKAIFVGINKHLNATIPELSGARRDATALWACLAIQSMGCRHAFCSTNATRTRFHLRSAHQILSTPLPDQPGFLHEILRRLDFGLPAAVLPLTQLQVPLTRGQCLALAAVGLARSRGAQCSGRRSPARLCGSRGGCDASAAEVRGF